MQLKIFTEKHCSYLVERERGRGERGDGGAVMVGERGDGGAVRYTVIKLC